MADVSQSGERGRKSGGALSVGMATPCWADLVHLLVEFLCWVQGLTNNRCLIDTANAWVNHGCCPVWVGGPAWRGISTAPYRVTVPTTCWAPPTWNLSHSLLRADKHPSVGTAGWRHRLLPALVVRGERGVRAPYSRLGRALELFFKRCFLTPSSTPGHIPREPADEG